MMTEIFRDEKKREKRTVNGYVPFLFGEGSYALFLNAAFFFWFDLAPLFAVSQREEHAAPTTLAFEKKKKMALCCRKINPGFVKQAKNFCAFNSGFIFYYKTFLISALSASTGALFVRASLA
jgi:hypothetical protein